MGRPAPRYIVAICIPAGDHCATWFAYDLARLAATTAATREDVGLQIHIAKTAYLPLSRKHLATQALGAGATHILWLDSDMRFPKDALTRLLQHEAPIVAANYSTRRLPLGPVASDDSWGHVPHHTPDGATGVSSVQHVGMGLMLTDCAVFRALEKPWFALPYSSAADDFVGEDVWFCEKAREAGFPVLVDEALSQDVKHLGEWEFTLAQVNEWQALVDAAAAPPAIEVVRA